MVLGIPVKDIRETGAQYQSMVIQLLSLHKVKENPFVSSMLPPITQL